MEGAAIGLRLAEALTPYSPGRAKIIVALDRRAFQWQHLLLPPCPADDLPDVVRLQADYEGGGTDKEPGFDFLPLIGDEQTPQEVLAISLAASELAKIRLVCRAANLTLESVVPLAVGWPAITQQASPAVKTEAHLFVAKQASEATLWTMCAGRVVLFRQFQLATDGDLVAITTTIINEIRRTLLALSQHSESVTISLVGNPQDPFTALAKTMGLQLETPVQSLDLTTQHTALTTGALTTASALPLAGLAVDQSLGNRPLVDFLHPRQRPQAQVHVRTYTLAAIAGTLLIATLGWSGYANYHAPLNKAAKDQTELTLLEKSLDEFQEYEQQAAAIRDWKVETPNLLLHLQQFSKLIRPQPLEDTQFEVGQDIVLEKITLDKRELTLEAMARNSQAVQPLETRLRTVAYRPQRIKSDPSDTNKDYPWYLKSTIEITTASDPAEETSSTSILGDPETNKSSPNKAAAEEPSA